MAALSYDENPNVMIVGVGLIGQYLARHVVDWLREKVTGSLSFSTGTFSVARVAEAADGT